MRLMAVHAHPDDESARGAATLAKYAAEGHDVLVVTLTGGERGEILNPALRLAGFTENIAQVRRREMAEAAAILGVQHVWLGYADSGMDFRQSPYRPPEGSFALVPAEQSTGRLVEVVRAFRPHVMVTYDENGGYPHPDHLRCHEISLAAYEASANPGRYPSCGEPWTVSKIYYIHSPVRVSVSMMKVVGKLERWQRALQRATPHILADKRTHESGRDRSLGASPRLIAALDTLAQLNRRIPLAAVMRKPMGRAARSRRVTTRITCGDYLAQRDRALRAHATQVDPNGLFFVIPRELRERLWPAEKFELARTRVAARFEPETDLFAGIVDD